MTPRIEKGSELFSLLKRMPERAMKGAEYLYIRTVAFVGMVLAMLVCSVPAFAQTDPFSAAVPDVQKYMGYALGVGMVALGVIAGIGVGKSIFKKLTS